MPRRPDILLLGSRDGSAPYIPAFDEAGLSAVCVPVVSFTYVNARGMLQALARPDEFGGLIVTSPRTTNAWAREPAARSRLTAWKDKPAYAVGSRTAAEARALGLRPLGQDAGSAEALAAFIARRYRPPEGASVPLLFCCGEPRRDELPGALRAADVPLAELVVYRSHVLEKEPVDEPPRWVVFFSPRSMDAAASWSWPWDDIRKGTVGTTTASAIAEYGWTADAAAGYHDVEGLIGNIRQTD